MRILRALRNLIRKPRPESTHVLVWRDLSRNGRHAFPGIHQPGTCDMCDGRSDSGLIVHFDAQRDGGVLRGQHPLPERTP